MEHNATERAPYSPYSPNLAPLNFYLFGHVKQLPRRCEFADPEALLHATEDILSGIEKEYWTTFFSAGWTALPM
jgi:hypothetical protein